MSSRRLLCLMVLGLLVGLSACGGSGGSSFGGPISTGPTPSISSLSPSSVTAGDPGFALTVNGSNFISGADVIWSNPGNPGFGNGSTSFVSASQVTKTISAADIAIPGTVQVTVLNVAAQSNALTFVIKPGPPGGAQTVSMGANGVAPNGNSHDPVLSFNGRFVAFSSEATNLISPNAKFPQGYMRDTCIGAGSCTPATLLVSAVTGGSAASPAEGNALGGAIPRSVVRASPLRPAPGSRPQADSLVSSLLRAILLHRIPLFNRLTCETPASPQFLSLPVLLPLCSSPQRRAAANPTLPHPDSRSPPTLATLRLFRPGRM